MYRDIIINNLNFANSQTKIAVGHLGQKNLIKLHMQAFEEFQPTIQEFFLFVLCK